MALINRSFVFTLAPPRSDASESLPAPFPCPFPYRGPHGSNLARLLPRLYPPVVVLVSHMDDRISHRT
jgi:hypothetical protein